MNKIEELSKSLNRIDHRDIDGAFIEMISDDSNAFGKEITPCIVTTTESDYKKFRAHFPHELFFQPLSSFSDLLESHYRSIDRCKVVVVFSKATQLVPFKLSQLMAYSDKNNIPVFVVITGMDRVISQESVNISGQISSIMPKNNYKWIDANKHSNTEALRQEILSFTDTIEQSTRSQNLTITRISQLKPLLDTSLERLIKYQKDFLEFIQIVDGFHKKDLLLEVSLIDEATDSFKSIIESIQKVDPLSVVGSLSDSEAQELLKLAIVKTSQALTQAFNENRDSIKDSCKSVSKKLNERNLNRLEQMTKEVLRKYVIQIENPSVLSTVQLDKYTESFFRSAESIIADNISIPQYLILLAKYDDVLKHSINRSKEDSNILQNVEKVSRLNNRNNQADKGQKTTDNEVNDCENEESDVSLPIEEIKKILTSLPSQLIQSKLPEVIQACLNDICDRLAHLITQVNSKMKEDIEELINYNYNHITKGLLDEKFAIEKRLSSIFQVLDEIK